MRVVIVGGTGLIGSATGDRLAQRGIHVTLSSRQQPLALGPGIEWRRSDVANADDLHQLMAATKPDAVVHLAALLQFACEQQPEQAVRINVDGTLNVLEACRTLGVARVVFGSSIAVYGERFDLMREEDPPSTRVSLYGMTKRIGEALGERFAALYGIEFVGLRYTGVFGPGEVRSPGMARVREVIKRTALGLDVVVDEASGDERIHLTHIDDAAEATCRALLHPRPSHTVYNVGGPEGNHLTLKEFHAAIRDLVPNAGQVQWAGRSRSAGPVDLTRLRGDLGYVPSITVARGLAADLRTMSIDNGSTPR
jgi:UDP-glucose 4-epimerase